MLPAHPLIIRCVFGIFFQVDGFMIDRLIAYDLVEILGFKANSRKMSQEDAVLCAGFVQSVLVGHLQTAGSSAKLSSALPRSHFPSLGLQKYKS